MRQETLFPVTFCFTILHSLSLSFSVFGTRSSRVRHFVTLSVREGIDIAPIFMVVSVETSHSPSFMSTPAECAVAPAQRRMKANRTTVRRVTFFMIDPSRMFSPDCRFRKAYHIDAGLHPCSSRSPLPPAGGHARLDDDARRHDLRPEEARPQDRGGAHHH